MLGSSNNKKKIVIKIYIHHYKIMVFVVFYLGLTIYAYLNYFITLIIYEFF